ncbi:uncharacterized protein BCR38DRAFT_406802 [Pseudomassariella vexata]|uniref:Uncharacterized protein n=1 Tax=Pseudomassariella vexata TaxID=1141098 RepID=A0A1Y2EC97_9PEZI|nr:uncharacterized protein BCR38DRAFT_406802 [Pseudomassariella vexata]ORY68924.1 hypothetical protein BCR38DRAFT_406802 [Pseudomassariella vexata]
MFDQYFGPKVKLWNASPEGAVLKVDGEFSVRDPTVDKLDHWRETAKFTDKESFFRSHRQDGSRSPSAPIISQGELSSWLRGRGFEVVMFRIILKGLPPEVDPAFNAQK